MAQQALVQWLGVVARALRRDPAGCLRQAVSLRSARLRPPASAQDDSVLKADEEEDDDEDEASSFPHSHSTYPRLTGGYSQLKIFLTKAGESFHLRAVSPDAMNKILALLCAAVLPAAALHGQIVDRFQVGSRAITNPTAGNFPNVWPSNGNEDPLNAINGLAANKYLNFGRLNTGYLLTYTTAVTADGINFFTANDTEARDPSSFTLYGSNTVVANATPGTTFNLADFTLIVDAQALSLPVARLTAASVSFTNATAYTTYLLVFPTVKNLAGANSMQVGDALLTSGGTPISTAGSVIAGGQLIPEPSSAALFVVCAAGCLGARRNSRRR